MKKKCRNCEFAGEQTCILAIPREGETEEDRLERNDPNYYFCRLFNRKIPCEKPACHGESFIPKKGLLDGTLRR